MTNESGSLVFPSIVRKQVLEQHRELRRLINDLLVDDLPSGGGRSSSIPGRLEAAGRELCARFRDHLAFEETELARVLAVVDTWGPERVMDLHQEHARQRAALDSFLRSIDTGAEIQRLTAAWRVLATDMLRDMDDEEQGCLRASLLSDHSLTIERR